MELTSSGPRVSGRSRCAHRLGDAHRRRPWNGCSTFERTRFATRLEPPAPRAGDRIFTVRDDDLLGLSRAAKRRSPLVSATRSSPPRQTSRARLDLETRRSRDRRLREKAIAPPCSAANARASRLRQDSADGLSRQAGLEVALRVLIEWHDDIVRVVCALVLLRRLALRPSWPESPPLRSRSPGYRRLRRGASLRGRRPAR